MDFINLAIIVFGILQIILFFKIWGMTNDIAKIKNKYIFDDYSLSPKQALIYGDSEKAANMIIAELANRLYDLSTANFDSKEERRKLISEAVNTTKEKLAIIDGLKHLPPHLQSMESFVNYYNRVINQF